MSDSLPTLLASLPALLSLRPGRCLPFFLPLCWPLRLCTSTPSSSQVLEAEGDKRKAELESEGQKIRMKNESEGMLIKVRLSPPHTPPSNRDQRQQAPQPSVPPLFCR